MPSTIVFSNRQIILPGAYSTIVSGENNPARNLDYGKVLIIDTGEFGAGFGGGAGIKGTNSQGQDTIYSFDNISDFRSFVKGGMYWKIAEALFTPDPSNPAAIGVSEILFVRAAETKPAKMTFTSTAGGTFVVNTLDEGTVANGVKEGDNLATGYGYVITPGVEDSKKWILSFYVGSYTGTAKDGLPYGEISALASTPTLVVQSPEFNNIKTLIEWAQTDSTFAQAFVLNPSSQAKGEGTVSESDVQNLLNVFTLASGGIEIYNQANFEAVLEQIIGLDYSFVFTDQYGDNANSAFTKAYIKHMDFDAKFPHQLFVGGYGISADYSKSIELAQGFDSDHIILTHGDVGLASDIAPQKYRWWTVMYNLCAQLGRTAGKEPMIPVTNKSIGIDRVRHILTESEQVKALKNGILVTVKNDYLNKFVVLQGVNTLQDNANLFNAKGQSYSIQFMRIVDQINKELVVNAEIDLLGQENGVNFNTLSAGAVKDWTVAYLQSRTATNETDNLLLAFQDVVVTRKEDAWFVTYKIRVNNEIAKLFFTGFLIR